MVTTPNARVGNLRGLTQAQDLIVWLSLKCATDQFALVGDLE